MVTAALERPYLDVYCKAEGISIAKLPVTSGARITREYVRDNIEFTRTGFNFLHSANFSVGAVVLCKCGNPIYIKDSGETPVQRDAKGKIIGEVPLTLGTMSFAG